MVSKEKTEAQAATMIVADVPAVPAAAAAAMPTAQPTASTSKVALTPSRFIAAGDLVIIFLSRDRPPVPLTVTSGQELVNPYGSFPHDDMIGLPFGAKVSMTKSLLQNPAHSDILNSLPHATIEASSISCVPIQSYGRWPCPIAPRSSIRPTCRSSRPTWDSPLALG